MIGMYFRYDNAKYRIISEPLLHADGRILVYIVNDENDKLSSIEVKNIGKIYKDSTLS